MLRSFPEWRSYAGGGGDHYVFPRIAGARFHAAVRSAGYVVMGGPVALVTTGILILIDASALEYLSRSDMLFYLALVTTDPAGRHGHPDRGR